MYTQQELDSHFRKHINFRDLGGYPAAGGLHIRPGLLYRSAGLSFMNEEELSFFRTLGVRYVMDLRTKTETELYPDPVLEDVCFLQHSGLEFANAKEIDFSPAGMSQIGGAGLAQIEKLRLYYNLIPFDNEAFRILFEEIRAQHAPLLFHCATGKDRTGVFAMVLLLALGVPRQTVLEDYLLSRTYFHDTLQQALDEQSKDIALHPELEELLTLRLSVTQAVGEGVLDALFSKYPVIEDYFLAEYGLDDEALTALRLFYCA
ncbi:MAG: tyrosine-protein phosphatase [Lachnospiraceae bacterium]|nr:tyrosine-protein phosphatase [Lachnospiraceae bacterium]